MLRIPPTKNHRQLARFVNTNALVDAKGRRVVADVEPWRSNTDRKNGRLRVAGRGRRGLRLQIRLCTTPAFTGNWFIDRQRATLFEHISSETYRTHEEARAWIAANLRRKR